MNLCTVSVGHELSKLSALNVIITQNIAQLYLSTLGHWY